MNKSSLVASETAIMCWARAIARLRRKLSLRRVVRVKVSGYFLKARSWTVIVTWDFFGEKPGLLVREKIFSQDERETWRGRSGFASTDLENG